MLIRYKEEYDFSKGDRGKFYRPNATLSRPIYLDVDALDHLSAKAEAKGIEIRRTPDGTE